MTGTRVAAVVLAGGEGRRLGAAVPKPLVTLGGRPMIEHVLARLPGSIAPVLIGAREEAPFAAYDRPVVPDRFADRRGPLAGLDAAAGWLRAHEPTITHLVSVPGDTPFLPYDLVERLVAEPTDRPRIAAFREILQPTVALWPLSLLDSLAIHLQTSDDLSVTRFARSLGAFATLEIGTSDSAPFGDPFFNVNTPDELAVAHAFLKQ